MALLTLVSACGGNADGSLAQGDAAMAPEDDSDAGQAPAPPQAVTWHKDVAPILHSQCGGCHKPEGVAPFDFTSYANTRGMAGAIAAATAAQTMPPWGARETNECQPRFAWRSDPRLSEDQKRILNLWATLGAPEGDAANATPLPPLPSTKLDRVDQALTPRADYVTQGGHDEFRCFVLDPQLAAARNVTGSHVVPGNPAVVHHAVVIVDPTRASAKLAGPDGSYDCFGNAIEKIPDARLLEVWVPGTQPITYPEGVGIPVPKGSLIVMQIHYHPAGQRAVPDRTRVELRYTDDKLRWLLVPGFPFGNASKSEADGSGLLPGENDPPTGPAFFIPKNKSGHVEKMTFTWPKTTKEGKPMPPLGIYGIAPHMHYVGRDFLLEIERANPGTEPARECLIQDTAWDFEWQRAYIYDRAVEFLPVLRGCDKLHLRCTYDNTLDNPFVAHALEDAGLNAPVDVRLGEETLDEMCLAMVFLVLPVAP